MMYLIAFSIGGLMWMLGSINTTLERICDALEVKENEDEQPRENRD